MMPTTLDEDYSAQADVTDGIMAELSDDDNRISALMGRVESLYLRSHCHDIIDKEIRVILRATSRPHRMGHVLLVTGESGAGKSTTINYQLDQFESLKPKTNQYGDELRPMLRMKAPSDCTMRDLGVELLGLLGYSVQRDLKETAVYQRLRQQLKASGTKIIYIDEFQHVLDAPQVKGVRHLTDTLKNLLQEEGHPIFLIVSGLPEIAQITTRDPKEQMEGRRVEVAVPDLSFDAHKPMLIGTIVNLVAEAELQLSVEPTDDFILRLLHGARYRTGVFIRIIHYAIEDTLEKGQAFVSLGNWSAAYMRLVSQGRNVFTDDNYHTIIRAVMRGGKLGPEIDSQTPAPRKRRVRK